MSVVDSVFSSVGGLVPPTLLTLVATAISVKISEK